MGASMRALAGLLAITLSGCLVPNPAYDEGTASASGTGGTTGGSTGTTTAAPTSGGSDGSGSAGASSGGEATGDPVVTGGTTGGATGSTGEVGSTGEPLPACKASEELPLTVVPIDTGVVPSSMGTPCPWGGGGASCGDLNFGITEFYRLVNDGQGNRNAALIQFPREQVMQEIAGAGYSVDDLVGVRIELVVWEEIKMPVELIELQIDLLSAGDSVWIAGGHNAEPAVGLEPSFVCRQTENCATWTDAAGGPLAAAQPLGSLYVDPIDHPALDQDNDEGQYHMQIRSELLPGAPIRERMVADGLAPAFAVTLKSVRELARQVIGIKLYEAPWDGPTLWVELCQQWE